MNLSGLLPATDRHFYRSILLTLLLACLLIAATLWVYQRRIQRLRQQLHAGAQPPVSRVDNAGTYQAQNQTTSIHPARQAKQQHLSLSHSITHP